MKLNITQIVTKLRSNVPCHVTESDLTSDMGVIMNVNKRSYDSGSPDLNPKFKEFYDSGNTDLIEFAKIFLTALLAQQVDLVNDNGIISIKLQ